jgi:phosphatidylcholine synthase
VGAWLVHLYTASSALFGLLALTAIVGGRYRAAFAWLALTIVIDATDGLLARRADVGLRLPHFNGAKLDDIVDYITYVFVPAFFIWHASLVPAGWSLAAAGAVLLSSAYGFNIDQAKTADHFYTGFPSYWNIVVFYLFMAGWPALVNLVVLCALAVLVFVPIRYVYPSRTPVWRTATVLFGVGWGVMVIEMVRRMPDVPRWLFWTSLAFPVYYAALSLALDRKRLWRKTEP